MTNAWDVNVANDLQHATINGVPVAAGTNFIDAVSQAGRNQGYGTVRVTLNGSDVSVTAAPQVLNAGDPEVLFATKTEAYKSGYVVGNNLTGVKLES